MSHCTGTIKSFDPGTGSGYLSCNEDIGSPVLFNAHQVDGLKSLVVGEPVSYQLTGDSRQGHAEHVQRTMGNLEAYQNFGGLYS